MQKGENGDREKGASKTSDGREVWRITYVRYRDAASGKFISVEDDPDLKLEMSEDPDLDLIEAQVLSTLAEIAADPILAAKSSASVRMLLGLVEKMKRDAEPDEGEWFILGRELAGEVLALLEKEADMPS